MSGSQQFRDEAMAQMQGAMSLSIAFIGISNGLFSSLAEMAQAGLEELSAKTGLDSGYLHRWCDAAFSFGLLDEINGKFALTDRAAPLSLILQALPCPLLCRPCLLHTWQNVRQTS